jgi:hypothetical protein
VIVDFFLTALLSIIGPALNALPTSTFSAQDAKWTDSLYTFDRLVPVMSPLRTLATILAAFTPILVFRFAVFLWKLIRG